jgi:K+-sensing histidine kinase KdpD
MEYEKLERKKLDLILSKFNAWRQIISLVETHKKRLKENKQRIKVVWEVDLILKADNDLFNQLIHNLIWNFLKYAWKKTLLKVNITKRYIDFSDDGKWVKSSEIPFLAEKFYQSNIEKTWDIDARWIGVWLSIIKKIVESHGWKFEIKSDSWKWFSFKIFI